MKKLIWRQANKLLTLCLLAVSLATGVQAQILPDGTLDTKELDKMELVAEAGTHKMYIKETEKYYYVSIKTAEIYVASLCLCNGHTVSVLHASAALGKLDFEQAEDGTWRSNKSFVWEMREKDFSKETINKRKEYLEQNGWVANTMEMGKVGETEFIISKNWLTDQPRFAMGLMPASSPEDTFSLPDGKAPACGSHSLVSGAPATHYLFTPDNWIVPD